MSFLSFALTWGPISTYTIIALRNAKSTTSEKVSLMCLITVGVILSLVCLINKYSLRCRTWLILIGLWACLDSILGTIMVIAITQCLDELIVAPAARHYRRRLAINKEIDRRA